MMISITWINWVKRQAPNKDKEVADEFKASYSKICHDSMELSKLKNQFTTFNIGSGALENVNALGKLWSLLHDDYFMF